MHCTATAGVLRDSGVAFDPMRKRTQEHGFSLGELIAVVVIISVLAGLALPRYTSVIERSRAAEGIQILTALRSAQWAFRYETGNFAEDFSDLDVEFPAPEFFDTITDSSVDDDPVEIAIVSRTTGDYTLAIDEDGAISCNDSGGSICGKLGY